MTLGEFALKCEMAKTREDFINLKEDAIHCGQTGLPRDPMTMFKAGEIFQRYKALANL
jgi:hypothetical protein